jgi:hypothetical protein
MAADVGWDYLDASAKGALDTYYGRKVSSYFDLDHSQLGGLPIPYQGIPNRVCPNEKCPASGLQYPYGDSCFDLLMKMLAIVGPAAEPELEKEHFQLAYYICSVCFSIRGEYRCT